MQFTDLNVGVLFLLAVTSIGVYGITLGGWSSNNKYSMMGGIRSAAQLISYELALGLSVMVPVMLASSLSLREIVDNQAGWWNMFKPTGFIALRDLLAGLDRPRSCVHPSTWSKPSRNWLVATTPNIRR